MITSMQTRLVSYYNSLNKSEHRWYTVSITALVPSIYSEPQTLLPLCTPPRPTPENIRHSQRHHHLPRRLYCYLPSPCVNRPPTPTTLTPPSRQFSPGIYYFLKLVCVQSCMINSVSIPSTRVYCEHQCTG